MSIVNGYCSAEDVREQLGDTSAKLSLTMIERSINAASRAIDRYCSRRFWIDPAVVTRLYSPDDNHVVHVRDIATRTGLIVKTDDNLDGTFVKTWVTATDYQLEPLNADLNVTAFAFWRIRAIGTPWFPWSALHRPTVSVTARFGWSAIPDEVVEACVLKSVALFKRKDAPFAMASFGDSGRSVRIGADDVDVVSLLHPYLIVGT